MDLSGVAQLEAHTVSSAEIAATLATDTAAGLSQTEVERRRARFGRNSLPEPDEGSIVRLVLSQFASPLIYLLFVAAGIALALGHRSDAYVILVVLVINAAIGAFQEGRAQRSLRALRANAQLNARVIRDGQQVMITAPELVPGDVMLVEAGDAISADARLVELAAFQVAEAALTGESTAVAKHLDAVASDTPLADRTNMVFSGTYVTSGRARAIVTATGLATEIGKVAALAEQTVSSKTPLQVRIAQFGRYLVVGSLVLFGMIVGVGLLRGMALGDILMVGISQLVGIIPEGLPVAITVAFAVGVQRMARRRAIVRELAAVETLGSTTLICSDKTGTLTRNEMTAVAVSLPDGTELAVTGTGYQLDGMIGDRSELAAHRDVVELLEACVLCNDAQLSPTHDVPIGDPTEIALLVLAIKGGIDPAALRQRLPRSQEIPFDAVTKMMATAHRSERDPFIVIKGAPELVIDLCRETDREQTRSAFHAAAERMANRALRVLAFAIVDGAELTTTVIAELRGRARFVGLVGQIDPPRAEAGDAVARCRGAGIRPMMITGDHPATAIAIARSLGIAREDDLSVDGRALARLSDAELAAQIERISVFARVQPEQKLRIVAALQHRGDVVAMTGDGVNDAPALVKADVGVAMGKTGTEVAKEASKIVITDDNFATIVHAVEEGRAVYRNISKAVLCLFSTSGAEVLVLFTAILLGYPPPFAAVQILWNNLVTEGLITVNLVLDPPEGDEMARPPIRRSEPLLHRAMLIRLSVMIPTIAITTLGWFIYRINSGVPLVQVQTETFTLLAICEWFNVLNCRSETRSALNWSLLRNHWLLGGLVLANFMQVAAVFWPPLSSVLHTVPFDLDIVITLGLLGSAVLWVEEVRKFVVRRAARRANIRA